VAKDDLLDEGGGFVVVFFEGGGDFLEGSFVEGFNFSAEGEGEHVLADGAEEFVTAVVDEPGFELVDALEFEALHFA